MKTTGKIFLLATAILLSACAVQHPEIPMANDPHPGFSDGEAAATRTILLVSLDDGTVIRQSIDVDAEICFKQNSARLTTCFSQGAAIVDPSTQEIIGYEMIEDQIDLIAKSD